VIASVAMLLGMAIPASAHTRSHSYNGCSASSGHQTTNPKAVWINSHNCEATRARVGLWVDAQVVYVTTAWTAGNAYAQGSNGTYAGGGVGLANGGSQSGWLSH